MYLSFLAFASFFLNFIFVSLHLQNWILFICSVIHVLFTSLNVFKFWLYKRYLLHTFPQYRIVYILVSDFNLNNVPIIILSRFSLLQSFIKLKICAGTAANQDVKFTFSVFCFEYITFCSIFG